MRDEDPAPSALLQHAMQMLASAEEEERSLTAAAAAAYTQHAEAQVSRKLCKFQANAVLTLYMPDKAYHRCCLVRRIWFHPSNVLNRDNRTVSGAQGAQQV